MSKVKNFVIYVWHLRFLKYVLVCVIGIAIIGFMGRNSVLGHLQNKYEISELEKQISQYDEQTERDMKQIRELERNPKAIEKIARERYLMKTEDEDIFVLSKELEEMEIDE